MVRRGMGRVGRHRSPGVGRMDLGGHSPGSRVRRGVAGDQGSVRGGVPRGPPVQSSGRRAVPVLQVNVIEHVEVVRVGGGLGDSVRQVVTVNVGGRSPGGIDRLGPPPDEEEVPEVGPRGIAGPIAFGPPGGNGPVQEAPHRNGADGQLSIPRGRRRSGTDSPGRPPRRHTVHDTVTVDPAGKPSGGITSRTEEDRRFRDFRVLRARDEVPEAFRATAARCLPAPERAASHSRCRASDR